MFRRRRVSSKEEVLEYKRKKARGRVVKAPSGLFFAVGPVNPAIWAKLNVHPNVKVHAIGSPEREEAIQKTLADDLDLQLEMDRAILCSGVRDPELSLSGDLKPDDIEFRDKVFLVDEILIESGVRARRLWAPFRVFLGRSGVRPPRPEVQDEAE